MTTNPEPPKLLAFLMCEDILEQEGVATLYRVIDTINLDMGVGNLPPDIASQMSATFKCQVFVRWGPGEGEFVQRLALLPPDRPETFVGEPLEFQKPDGHHFAQFRYPIGLMLKTEGMYEFRLYLNGEQVAEYPFKVNITVHTELPTTLPS